MFIVMTKSAYMPSSCWGKYVRVGVVELEPGFSGTPTMLSERAIGVKRVVQTWEPCHLGTSRRCAAAKAKREAELLAAELNKTTA